MIIENFEGYFLILCLAITGFFFYLLFKPFFAIIALAMVIAVVFYKPYSWLRDKLNGREGLASLIMCLVVITIIIIPIFYFILVLKDKSVELYGQIQTLSQNGIFKLALVEEKIQNFEVWVKGHVPILEQYNLGIKEYLLGVGVYLDTYIIANVTDFIKGTTRILTSILFFFLTLYYLFKDGRRFAQAIMRLTPLSNKYDRRLFKMFTEVSMSSIVSTLVVAVLQGVITGFGMYMVGLPGFFGGLAASFLALLPLFGASIVWLPAAIYLFIVGDYGSGLFLILWGGVLVSLIDNVLRPVLMRGKIAIHPLLIFFSIFGGISLFGFLGIVFGPLVLALMMTFLHIYEIEYDYLLEKR